MLKASHHSSGGLEAGSGVVVRSLYRHCLRLSIKLDRHPYLKALLEKPSLYSPLMPPLQPQPHPAVESALFSLFGPNAMLYKPSVSMQGLVRHWFHSRLHPHLNEVESADLAFSCLRYLEHTISRARQLPATLRDHEEKHFAMPRSDPIATASSLSTAASAATWNTRRLRPVLQRPEAGCLLVAHPLLSMPFARQLILVVRHHADGGSIGVALNAKLPMHSVSSSARVYDEAAKPSFSHTLFWGGPAIPPSLSVLSSDSDRWSRDVVTIPNTNLYWSMWSQNVRQMAVNIPSRDTESSFRLLIGAMTWDEGELESEIQAGIWFITDAKDLTLQHLRDHSDTECENDIDDESTNVTDNSSWNLEHSNRLWKKIMREMGSEYTSMARLPISIIRPTS